MRSKFNISVENKDEEILNEMISKVDKNVLESLFRVSASVANVSVINGIVDKYLRIWAESKYEFYLMFGRNLKLSEYIESPLSEKEYRDLMDVIYKNFELYEPLLRKFEYDDIVENKCPVNENLEKWCDGYYKPGMKVSKFLSKYLKDDDFDKKFSEVLQNKKTKVYCNVSIDPVDILMMSENKNNWGSCYALTKNYYGAAPYSCMTDDSYIICYTHTGKSYDYSLRGENFSWISMCSRSGVFMDKRNCQITYLRGYIEEVNAIKNMTRRMITESVNKYVEGVDYKNEGITGNLFNYLTKHTHMRDDIFSCDIPDGEGIIYKDIGCKGLYSISTGKLIERDVKRNPCEGT